MGQRWLRLLAVGCLSLLVGVGGLSGDQPLASGGLPTPGPTPASVRIERGVPITPTSANSWYQPTNQTAHTDGLCRDYGSNNEICVSGSQPRAPEIVELARALGGGSELNLSDPAQVREHVNLVYEYVHRRIDTEFLFGSHKGALGTLIDGSGTAFDQANLMVQVLRQSGINADFVYGTLVLTPTQFQEWTGLTRRDSICDFLSLGGIPHQTANGCSTGSSPGNVTLSHVWVRASVNGQLLQFDPALKVYTHVAGINVRNAAQLPALGSLATATGSTNSSNGVYTAGGFDYAALGNSLGPAAERLRARLDDDDLSGASMVEIVGGRILQSQARPTNGWGSSTLAGHTQVALWGGGSGQGIPDQFRARITLSATRQTEVIDADFFVDEIYGRRLEVSSTPDPLAPSALTAAWNPQLSFDGVLLEQGPGEIGIANMNVRLIMEADHPFAAAAVGCVAAPPATCSGTYGDASGNNAVEKFVNLLMPASIVHGWGATSGELAARWDREQGQDRQSLLHNSGPPSSDDVLVSLSTNSGDLLRARIGATWLAQFSTARDLHAELAQSRAIHLHTLGVVSSLNHAVPLPGAWNPTPGMGSGFSIQDEVTVVDLETSFGLVSRQGNAVKRRAAVHAISATAATLEGSVVGELTDSPDAISTAARFAWGASPGSETDDTNQRAVYGLSAGYAQNLLPLTRYDNDTIDPVNRYGQGVGNYGLEPVSAGVAQGLRDNLEAAILSYSRANFSVVASSEANLGPGHRHGSEFAEWTITLDSGPGAGSGYSWTEAVTECLVHQWSDDPTGGHSDCYNDVGNPGQSVTFGMVVAALSDSHEVGSTRTITGYARNPTLQRGGAFIATRYAGVNPAQNNPGDENDPLEIAHVLTRYGPATKGGGGPSVTQGQRFDPASAADVLADRFQDRSSTLGVDLSSGSVGYSTPILQGIGQGEFPFRLEHTLAIRGGAVRPVSVHGGPMDPLVVSSLDGDSVVSSSGREAMGASRPEAAASTIVAFLAMQDIWTQSRSAEREVNGVLVAHWWASRIIGNVLTVFQGAQADQFVRVGFPASGVSGDAQRLYRTTSSGPETAVLSQERVAVRPQLVNALERPQLGRQDPNNRQLESTVRMWTYPANTTLTVTGSGADQRSFFYSGGVAENEPLGFEPRHERFWLANWTFPYGVVLTYNRTAGGLSVESNLGFELDVDGYDALGLQAVNLAASCYDPQFAPLAPTARFQATNAAGEVSRVEFARRLARTPTRRPTSLCQVEAVYSPDDQLTPSVVYHYDTLGRVMGAQDAISIRAPGTRGGHRFYIADGYRGARRDALGALYSVETMNFGRRTRHIDELGRVTVSGFDGRGRVISRTYPEGNQQQFEYDGRGNTTLMRQVARPDDPATTGVDESRCTTTGVVATTPAARPSEFVRDACQDIVVQAAWHAEFNKPLWIEDTGPDGQLRRTDFTYYGSGSGRGLLERVERPAPSGTARPTYLFTYTPLGLVSTSTDAAMMPTAYVYNPTNNFLIETHVGWANYELDSRYFVNDAQGRVIETFDDRAGVAHTYFTYDAMDRVTREVRQVPGQAAGRWERQTDYNLLGQPIEVRQRLVTGGSETWPATRTGYTPTGQPWWVQDPAGDTVLTTYDAMDRRISVTDPEGVSTVFAYDAAGQVLTETRGVINGAGGELFARYGYTLNGQQAWIRDGRRDSPPPYPSDPSHPLNNTATFRYDGHGRLMRTTWPDGSAPGYNFEELVYGPSGQIVRRRTREGLIIRTCHDRLDRPTAEVERLPDYAGTTACDQLGTDTTARSAQWWRSYDSTFQYDLAGRMTVAATAQVTRGWEYGGLGVGRPTRHTRTGGGTNFDFTYDDSGNLEYITHGTGGGVRTHYVWDPHGRMGTAALQVAYNTVGSASIAYDTMDRRTAVTFGDGSSQSYTWEADNDLIAIGHVYPNRTSDNATWTYAHDRIGRVTSEQISHAAYTYTAASGTCTYGAATAINTYPSVCGTTIGYVDSVNPNQLQSDGAIHTASPWNYRYDGHGNLRNTASLDYQNQTSYYPDALGERFYTVHYDTQTGPQTAFYSASDGLRPEIIQEPTYSRPANTGSWVAGPTRSYVLGPLPDERLIYRAADGQIYYPHTDRRGSTVALSKGGMAVETYAYDEFGQGGATGSSGYPWRYTGQRLDPWTGSYHYKAREYAPRLGRFLQPDPAGFVDGPNAYSYVGNNPWNMVDPTGRESWAIVYRDQRIELWDRFGITVDSRTLGHIGYLHIDDRTGVTSYVEWGRYDENNPGSPRGSVVWGRNVPDLVPADGGGWTPDSMNALVGWVRNHAADSGSSSLLIVSDPNADNAAAALNVAGRYHHFEEYDGLVNSCLTFVRRMWEAAGGAFSGERRRGSDSPRPNTNIHDFVGQSYYIRDDDEAERAIDDLSRPRN